MAYSLISQSRGNFTFQFYYLVVDRLCSIVVGLPNYRSRGPGFDSRSYHIFWVVVGLEPGPLSLVGIIRDLPEWNSSSFDLETEINGRWDPMRLPRDIPYSQSWY
jgi:hypothetical protein